MEAGDSRSSSDSSGGYTRSALGGGMPPPSTEHLHKIHYINRTATEKPPPPAGVLGDPAKDIAKGFFLNILCEIKFDEFFFFVFKRW